MNDKKNIVPPKAAEKPKEEKMQVEFIPFGSNTKVRLTAAMIRNFIAIPTRSGALPSERDCVRFLLLCKGKRANPFEGDCFLIGYDSQNGPSFSMVCGIELFLKRAEDDEKYDGSEYGVIVSSAEGGVTERQGAIIYQNEKLEGGWARAFRRDRAKPYYKAVKFSAYDTGRSRWEKDPGGQIAKVALSQALREAYPKALGGIYTQMEMERVTESGDNVAQIREPVSMPEVIDAPIEQQTAIAAPEPELTADQKKFAEKL
jgi:phage recombination protein Bet